MTNHTIPLEEVNKINRAVRYKRQAVSAAYAQLTNHSVRFCMNRSHGNKVEVLYSQKSGKAYYHGLMTCGSVWDCPVCAAKISARRSDEIKEGVNNWYDRGGVVAMVTYTLRHDLGDSLGLISRTMTNAIRFVHSGAPYGRIKEKYAIKGSISATEILYNSRNGWHYHKHQLIFIDAPGLENEALEKWIYARYNKYLNQCGFGSIEGIGVRVSPAESVDNITGYITKWGLHNEITAENKDSQSGITPFELLDDEKYRDQWLEYSRTMYGKRRLTWSAGLRDLLGLTVELTDEQIAEQREYDQADVIELALINRQYWGYIVKNNLRAEVLDHAERGPEHFQEWYYHRVIKRFYLNL